ncbi:hypothetical protein [Ulvibacterium marinum]|nr:hypothetical protein [Ulvibacterium marinum]
MDLFEKNNLVYGILKKIRDTFRPIFDSGNPRTVRENELRKNLRPDLIRIKK